MCVYMQLHKNIFHIEIRKESPCNPSTSVLLIACRMSQVDIFLLSRFWLKQMDGYIPELLWWQSELLTWYIIIRRFHVQGWYLCKLKGSWHDCEAPWPPFYFNLYWRLPLCLFLYRLLSLCFSFSRLLSFCLVLFWLLSLCLRLYCCLSLCFSFH